MPELLLELFSEEIPARLQARAAGDLRRLITDGLKGRGLDFGDAGAFATPRRLALVIDGVPSKSPVLLVERKGPRVGAPQAAVRGFLKAAGLSSLSKALVVKDEKKGDYYLARTKKPGRKASEIIAEVVHETIVQFPWPNSMRFNRFLDTGNGTELRWIRPLHSIICLLGGKVIPLEIAGIKAGKITRGHRFLGNEPFAVTGFADYRAKLQKQKVILNAADRADIIDDQARALAKDARLALVADEALLAENAGLTEWPIVLMGTFDKSFLEVPAECLVTAMKIHQKCFSLREKRSKKLANKFLLVSNLKTRDAGKKIIAGNEKVIAARLSDAKFFWQQDLKRPLDEMANALDGIIFHAKLGTQKERVERIAELAFRIAGSVDAVPEDARRAAQLCKADLVSGMVGEFPELQGLMGSYYAEAAGAKPEIARAIELHYKPKGVGDTVPKEEDGDAVSLAVALADKLDTLAGFWTIGEKPTGSGDPYQLRRAALGVIRIVLENDLRLPIVSTVLPAFRRARIQMIRSQPSLQMEKLSSAELDELGIDQSDRVFTPERAKQDREKWLKSLKENSEPQPVEMYLSRDLLSFLADRLKVHLREKGAPYDLIDAVFSLGGQDDLALIVKRVEALSEFLQTEDGANLLTGVKRAQNILTIEEKKDKTSYAGTYDVAWLQDKEELALAAAIESVKQDTDAAINVENFAGAMRALAELRAPVDAFFEHVTVNVDDPKLRENRLRMLSEIRAATLNVADLTKISG
jgi:glycyl-tRNA synthetase beta chain